MAPKTHPYEITRKALGPVLRRCFPADVEGIDDLPRSGPVILAPNHVSIMDSVILASVVPRRMAFIAKAEHFEDRRSGWLMRLTGQIPLERGNGLAAGRALKAAGRVLRGGDIVTIFPEGTRSRDGLLHHGNTGPARLAARYGAPIVPVGLVGTAAVHAPGERRPHPFRTVTVRFGHPLIAIDDGRPRRERVADLTDALMRSIADLAEQDLADDWYRHQRQMA